MKPLYGGPEGIVAHNQEHERILRERISEVQRRMDAVVEAAVAWHQSGQEGDNTWFDKAEILGAAIDSLIELREPPQGERECSCGTVMDALGCPNGH